MAAVGKGFVKHGLALAAALLPLPLLASPSDLLIEAQLAPQLERQRALEPDLSLNLTFTIAPPAEAEAVEDFRFNASSGDFIARLRLQDGRSEIVQGRAVFGVETWVPVRRLEAGEIIGPDDLRAAIMPPGIMTAAMLRDASDIPGKEVRRPLAANRPVQDRSLIEPRAVIKGGKVEIRLKSKGLQLAAPGKALADGAMGDLIRVVNVSSNAILTAEVTAPGVVEVK